MFIHFWFGAVSPLAAVCSFTSQQMVVPDLQDVKDFIPGYVLDAIEAYHATKPYTQTPEQFRAAPGFYFQRRMEALKRLLDLLKNAPLSPLVEDLIQKSQNKLAYLSEVPKELHSDYIHRRLCRKQKKLLIKSSPLLSPRRSYWVEWWDPLRRAGPEVQLRIALWKKSPIPSFFIFLETIENDAALNQEAPFTHQVVYLNAEEREKQRLEFRNGLAYLGGIVFDTKTYLKQFPGAKITIYVLSEEGVFYIFPHKRYIWQHSSMLRAAPVVDAGEMFFEQGVLKKIANRSGHYAPTKETLLRSLKKLHEKIPNLEAVEVKIFEFHPVTSQLMTRISYRADAFLAEEGFAVPVRCERSWKPLHAIVWNDDRSHFPAVYRPHHLNAQDRGGNTPLHLALIKGNWFMARQLLALGADPTIPNRQGETVYKKFLESFIQIWKTRALRPGYFKTFFREGLKPLPM